MVFKLKIKGRLDLSYEATPELSRRLFKTRFGGDDDEVTVEEQGELKLLVDVRLHMEQHSSISQHC